MKADRRELLLWGLAALLGIGVCLTALLSAPDISPIGVVYTDVSTVSEASESIPSKTSVIPAPTEAPPPVTAVDSSVEESKPPASAAPSQPAETRPQDISSAVPSDGKIHLNSATKEELMTLNGIGETLAERIIEYRDTHGGFARLEELTEVKGIGEKRFAAIRDFLVLD